MYQYNSIGGFVESKCTKGQEWSIAFEIMDTLLFLFFDQAASSIWNTLIFEFDFKLLIVIKGDRFVVSISIFWWF